ncbi:MAG: type VI secretion system baseplate subunit TssE [Gemmatimonadota bacterium]|jgi:type VI secretion system protein ImpF
MAEDLVRQSVLDRLMGTDLIRAGGGDKGRPARSWEESVKLLERNVLRDLEQLLNTRQVSEPAEAPFDHLADSLYNYGLLDFASLSADAAGTADQIRRLIQEAIERFEPRLTDVEVVDPDEGEQRPKEATLRRRVRFRVEATLRTDPDPERVEFDTVLETTSKRFEVSVEPHA